MSEGGDGTLPVPVIPIHPHCAPCPDLFQAELGPSLLPPLEDNWVAGLKAETPPSCFLILHRPQAAQQGPSRAQRQQVTQGKRLFKSGKRMEAWAFEEQGCASRLIPTRGLETSEDHPDCWSDGWQRGEGGTPRSLSKDQRHIRRLGPVQDLGPRHRVVQTGTGGRESR